MAGFAANLVWAGFSGLRCACFVNCVVLWVRVRVVWVSSSAVVVGDLAVGWLGGVAWPGLMWVIWWLMVVS